MTFEAVLKTYTTREVSKILQLHEAKVRKLLNTGRLLGTRIDRLWRITPEAIQKFLEDNSNGRDS